MTYSRTLKQHIIPDHRSNHKAVICWDVEDDFVFQLPVVADVRPATAAAGS